MENKLTLHVASANYKQLANCMVPLLLKMYVY